MIKGRYQLYGEKDCVCAGVGVAVAGWGSGAGGGGGRGDLVILLTGDLGS